MTALLLIKMGVLEGHSHDCSKDTNRYIYKHKNKVQIKTPFRVGSLNDALKKKNYLGMHFRFNASVLAVIA